MPPKKALSSKGFPWEDLKAETLRSISLDLLQGTSGKSYLISRTRDTNIAFLKSVAEHGVEEAIRLAIENAPETQSTSASAARRSASTSAPVKRKRDEREEGASNRSTRSKGRADYPYGTRNQGKPQKQLEALGITGPKRQRKSASARPGPLSRTKKAKAASSAKPVSQSTESPKATKLVFDGVEIPTLAATKAMDSISQNGDAENDDAEGEGEEEGEDMQAQEREHTGEEAEQTGGEGTQSGEEWERTGDETMKVDGPAPRNPYEPSTSDEQEEHEDVAQQDPQDVAQQDPLEGEQEEHQVEEPPQTDEAQVEEHEQSGVEDEPPLTGEVVEATPSEDADAPHDEIQQSSSAEVGTALEDAYVGGDEDAAGEPETDPMQADEGSNDATNDESVLGMQLDVTPENLVPAV